ncbi:hypothetical protein V5N11_009114 [Cardamine amara subsp. amara]|uniref:Reverse transcriptase zinc-binding domain-containing protein n=1 Tax=Cardamine amara subsp. amara TaxID=228776 RepID=A0ABD1C7L5_CARAN
MGPSQRKIKKSRVADLLMEGSMEWDRGKIRELLPAFEQTILEMKPSTRGAEDTWAWIPTETGQYSTKSRYFEALKLECQPSEPNQNEDFNWLSNIWNVKCSPKQKILLWKAMHNAIPVGENLKARNIDSTIKCVHRGEEETITHLFFNSFFSLQRFGNNYQRRPP